MKLKFVTTFKDGLKTNYKELKKNELYQEKHGSSQFKYLYDNYESDYSIQNLNVISVVAYDLELNIPIGVLLFLRFKENKIEEFKGRSFIISGELGIYINPNYRGLKISKKLIKEFENNFFKYEIIKTDYIVINAFEKAYDIAFKYLSWIIPNNKRNFGTSFYDNIDKAIGEKNIRSSKYYRYRKKD